jgi:hypothetical protein
MAEEQQEETTTQKLQNKVDRLKLLNLTDNIHHISSTAKTEEV